MITEEDLHLAMDQSVTEEALEAALAHQPPVRWGPASPELLEAYARKPVLQRGEAVALLQGFRPPAPEFGDDKVYYLDEFADVIQRLLRDTEAGLISMPCRPVELVEWATMLGASLPGPFRAMARPTIAAPPSNNPTCSTPVGPSEALTLAPTSVDTSEALTLPTASEPIGISEMCGPVEAKARPTEPSSAAGQIVTPARTDDDHACWQTLAEVEAREYRAANGKWPTKTYVAKLLAKRIAAHAPTIERRIRNTWQPCGRGNWRSSSRSSSDEHERTIG